MRQRQKHGINYVCCEWLHVSFLKPNFPSNWLNYTQGGGWCSKSSNDIWKQFNQPPQHSGFTPCHSDGFQRWLTILNTTFTLRTWPSSTLNKAAIPRVHLDTWRRRQPFCPLSPPPPSPWLVRQSAIIMPSWTSQCLLLSPSSSIRGKPRWARTLLAR